LNRGLGSLLGKEIPVTKIDSRNSSIIIGTPENSDIIKKLIDTSTLESLGGEGFIIKSVNADGNDAIIITANEDIGLLYGAFHFLRLLQTQTSLKDIDIISKPKIQYRLLNHWDNLNGTVERGYAGKSLWKWDQLPETIDPRYTDYARVNASLGINGTVLNNVNANPDILKEEYLIKVAKLAQVFRPYGIKVFLSINFSSPISSKFTLNSRRGGIGNLETSDPMNPEVRQW